MSAHSKTVFRITEKQYTAALERLTRKWANEPISPALVKQCYDYDLFEHVYTILKNPLSGGWLQDLYPCEVIRLASPSPARFTARTSGSVVLAVRQEHIDAAAKKVYRTWQSDANAKSIYPDGRVSLKVIRRMVVNTLCRVLGQKLADPDSSDLFDRQPRVKKQWIARYGVRRVSMVTSG